MYSSFEEKNTRLDRYGTACSILIRLLKTNSNNNTNNTITYNNNEKYYYYCCCAAAAAAAAATTTTSTTLHERKTGGLVRSRPAHVTEPTAARKR